MEPQGDRSAAEDVAGVLVRPPWVFLATLATALALHRLRPLPFVPMPLATVLGWIAVPAAVLWLAWGLITLRRAGTPVDPHRPARALVEAGPYRYSRNPLYLGLTVLLLGIALLYRNGWLPLLLVVALAVLHFGVVRREERYLDRRFGDAYAAYRRRVRRWL